PRGWTVLNPAPVRCVLELRTVLAIMTLCALVGGPERRAARGVRDVSGGRAVTTLASHLDALGRAAAGLKPARQAKACRVALHAFRVHLEPLRNQRLPRVRVIHVLPDGKLRLMTLGTRLAARDPVIGGHLRRKGRGQAALRGREVAAPQLPEKPLEVRHLHALIRIGAVQLDDAAAPPPRMG